MWVRPSPELGPQPTLELGMKPKPEHEARPRAGPRAWQRTARKAAHTPATSRTRRALLAGDENDGLRFPAARTGTFSAGIDDFITRRTAKNGPPIKLTCNG
ncbi:hypothetical protein Pmi06nite_27490 [Planotetraspora mira]|uniref:Uncharacterized protein n=1 Tax=Planotetraspora mira TaxID=58121 RepID=A0A8J3TQ16_9ACTN|nr:hypothetical protein Pmi06nite_27490 [Planotetraspora mira]